VLPRDLDDIHDPTWVGVEDPVDAPARLALAVTPNPMNLSSNVKFALPNTGRASIKVYNIQGQMVETLVDGNVDAGEHNVHWDGTNYSGNKVTSGIYFFKLETGKGSVISKVVVSR
jgi:flagellar hook assembly protein FlgD